MDLEVLVTSANILQSSIVFITFSANIPQWVTIHRNQSSKNISLISWMMWVLVSAIGLFYAVVQCLAYGGAYALIFTTIVSLSCNFYTVYLILRFREETQNISLSLQATAEIPSEVASEAATA